MLYYRLSAKYSYDEQLWRCSLAVFPPLYILLRLWLWVCFITHSIISLSSLSPFSAVEFVLMFFLIWYSSCAALVLVSHLQNPKVRIPNGIALKYLGGRLLPLSCVVVFFFPFSYDFLSYSPATQVWLLPSSRFYRTGSRPRLRVLIRTHFTLCSMSSSFPSSSILKRVSCW